VNKVLWPVLLSVALALFVGITWLTERAPAFLSVDQPLATLPIRSLDGTTVADRTRPTVVLVWLPG
jgi:hypothetical protein